MWQDYLKTYQVTSQSGKKLLDFMIVPNLKTYQVTSQSINAPSSTVPY